MSGPPSVEMLHGTQGDNRSPEISRKVTACAACRKQKIKCRMQNDRPPCVRCTRRGLSCTLNRSLQTILDSDAEWKLGVDGKIRRLESALEAINSERQQPSTPASNQNYTTPQSHSHSHESAQSIAQSPASVGLREGRSRRNVPPNVQARLDAANWTVSHDNVSTRGVNRWNVVVDPDAGPAAIPGSVVHEAALDEGNHSTTQNDLITRGILSLSNAQRCFDLYTSRMDHFVYSIMGESRSFDDVRTSSPLLLSACVTVGALHDASDDFEACFSDFKSSASAFMFTKHIKEDELRAVLIGAFWLSSISWPLVGTAVRIATELNFHRSIFKAVQGDRAHFMKTRLYYLVYVCDHQFSTAYGRPPMTQQDESIRASERFRLCHLATENDGRLVSQVEFWSISTRAFQAFGIEPNEPLPDPLLPQLRRLIVDFDACRAKWAEAFGLNQYVGNYPKKGLGLHNHFGKLFVFSCALRGRGQAPGRSPEATLEIDELACLAVLSATTIIRTITSDSELCECLNGLPTYFHIMLAFSVVFLLKVSKQHSELGRISVEEVLDLLEELVKVLRKVTAAMHPHHILVSVARGFESLLEGNRAEQRSQSRAANVFSLDNSLGGGYNALDVFAGSSGWDSFDLMDGLNLLQGEDGLI